MGSNRIGRREGLVLAITALSFAALVGAGLSSFGDPDLAGRAALARLSTEVAGGVLSEWDQLRRDPAWLGDETLAWSLEPLPTTRPAVELAMSGNEVVAVALLSEASRLEREEGDTAAALEVVLELLDRDVDAARRGEARLRAIQLGVRAARPEVVAAQWAAARAELSGAEALDETSLLLLCGLAAGPGLNLEQCAGVRDELIGLWVAGELALPRAEFEGSALREAYRERLQGLLPGAPRNPRLARSALVERALALRDATGAAVLPPADGGVGMVLVGERELLLRLRDPSTAEGTLVPVGTLASRVEQAVKAAGVLEPGFSLDFVGDALEAGPVVRERVPLGFGSSGFVLRHSNPELIVSEVGERQVLLRTALFVLALGVAGAGLSVARSLRRERHLAELKSTFVANVSHELRTPVASILLMSENLEDGRVSDAETRGRYHRLIRREAERLRTLVNDVLDFSRIERGKGVHLCKGEMDLRAFATELEAEARERVEAAGGQLVFSVDGVPEHLSADEDALRRATMNLVDNALRHSGSRDVEVELGGEARGGLLLTVRDRGRGVPAARLESLFRPFERLEVESVDAGGTGLGLAIVREIAEGHGGRAEARTPGGKGLVIELFIPATSMEERA